MIYNLLGLLALALDIYAVYLILTGSGDGAKKVLWILLILILPLIGAILYFVVGRQGSTA
jgi:hypothetical protein